MTEHRFGVKLGGLAALISMIVGVVWWYPTTVHDSTEMGSAADPRLLPAICLGIAACLLWADRRTLRIHSDETITHPTPKIILIWNATMVGMTGVFWWLVSPLQFYEDDLYCCTFCFGSIGFVALFTYVTTMNTIITWHALTNVRQTVRREDTKAGMAALLPVLSFLFVFWFGVYDSWEGWHLRLYWDDYQDVIQMDPDQLEELSPGWFWEPISGETPPPRLLPKTYQHLGKDGFAYSEDALYFFAWYGGPISTRGLMYSPRIHDHCVIPSTYITTDYACIEIRPNWYRFSSW